MPLAELLTAFQEQEPLLDVWRRYPEITEPEDSMTDSWACEGVTRDFVEFAQANGWEARAYKVAATNPHADLHTWAIIYRDDEEWAVDWTARQFHNLNADELDPAALAAPWPLVWEPAEGFHPVMGEYRHTGHNSHFGGTYWCDTCNSPYCELA